ncbi:MAG TPA: helix-turn-helix domain-containing protein [Allocoleopsis sp.]
MPAISASCNSKGNAHPRFANLVRETRQRLNLSQEKFAATLGVSFQSVNRWENGRTKPLPIALKQIEHLLYQMGEAGQDLLVKYFSE